MPLELTKLTKAYYMHFRPSPDMPCPSLANWYAGLTLQERSLVKRSGVYLKSEMTGLPMQCPMKISDDLLSSPDIYEPCNSALTFISLFFNPLISFILPPKHFQPPGRHRRRQMFQRMPADYPYRRIDFLIKVLRELGNDIPDHYPDHLQDALVFTRCAEKQ